MSELNRKQNISTEIMSRQLVDKYGFVPLPLTSTLSIRLLYNKTLSKKLLKEHWNTFCAKVSFENVKDHLLLNSQVSWRFQESNINS